MNWKEQTCGGCEFWKEGPSGNEEFGSCLRNPPVPIAVVFAQMDMVKVGPMQFQEQMVPKTRIEAIYPPVRSATPACAKFAIATSRSPLQISRTHPNFQA